MAVLITVGVHADTGTASAARVLQRSGDQAHEQLLDCLSARAHQLISPTEPVHAQGSDLEAILDLEGSLAPWASMVVGRAPASATLELKPGGGPGSCAGYALTTVPTAHR